MLYITMLHSHNILPSLGLSVGQRKCACYITFRLASSGHSLELADPSQQHSGLTPEIALKDGAFNNHYTGAKTLSNTTPLDILAWG